MRFRGVDVLVGMAYAATAALGMRRTLQALRQRAPESLRAT